MTLDVLDELTLARLGRVEVWVSLYWDEPYNTEGEFTLEVRPTEENLALLREGRWLRRSDSDVPMRICHRSNENTDSNLVITGFPGTWIFTKRACTSTVKSENAEAAMRRLVSAMQPWPKLELGAAVGFDTTYTAQTSGGSIMDYLMTIGAACDLGFRVRLSGKNDQKKLLFEVYRPTADPNNRFSTKWGNLQQAAWAFGDGDYANVAVVQGAGEGENRATVTVGLTDATGADRRELYVDARDVQPDEEKGETSKSQAYLERLMARGTNKLLEQLRTGSIELTIDAEGLSPGDVAFCTIPELGYKATVKDLALELVEKAELSIMGSGQGAKKKKQVFAALRAKCPAVIQWAITDEVLDAVIERAFDAMTAALSTKKA